MHSMYLAGVPFALVHVTATDPPRSGRHPNLIAHAVVADCGAYRMSAMAIIIARERRIVTAGITDCCRGWNHASCNCDRQ